MLRIPSALLSATLAAVSAATTALAAVAQPYPARAALGVSALPKGARVEMECILSL